MLWFATIRWWSYTTRTNLTVWPAEESPGRLQVPRQKAFPCRLCAAATSPAYCCPSGSRSRCPGEAACQGWPANTTEKRFVVLVAACIHAHLGKVFWRSACRQQSCFEFGSRYQAPFFFRCLHGGMCAWDYRRRWRKLPLCMVRSSIRAWISEHHGGPRPRDPVVLDVLLQPLLR